MMNERQQKIIQILSLRRYEKIDNLAFELNVARRTIERDLYNLSFDYPIYTIQGRNGGVEVMKEAKLNGFRLNQAETELLQKILLSLNGRDYIVLFGIIKKYGKPIKTKFVFLLFVQFLWGGMKNADK